MNIILIIIQVVVSVLLVTLILLQGGNSDLGSAFGSATHKRTRRGSDRFMFQMTIALATIFVVLSFVNVIVG